MRYLLELLAGPFGDRRTLYTSEQEIAAAENRAQAMIGAGWHRYIFQLPPRDEVVEFHNDAWPSNDFCRASEFRPEMNAQNLWWRPIQRDIEVSRQQMEAPRFRCS